MHCFLDNTKYKIKVERTYLLLYNQIHEIKISWFDIKTYATNNNNYIIFNLSKGKSIKLTQNNINELYFMIKRSIINLHCDVNISLLLSEDILDDWCCCICLENNKKNIIKTKCCGNYFHMKCFIDNFKSVDLYTCPICRSNKCQFCNNKYCINSNE